MFLSGLPWGSYAVFAMIASFTPGPNNILILSHAVKYGFRKCVGLILGILAGHGLLWMLCGIFSVTMEAYLPNVVTVMKFIGAAYILWLAWIIVRSKPGKESVDREGKVPSFWKGIILQFVNIKGYMYILTALSGFVLPYTGNIAGIAVMMAVAFCFSCGAVFSWAICGAMLEKLFLRYSRQVNALMALALVYCAVRLFV